MLKGKIFFIVVFFIALTIFSFCVSAVEGGPNVYYGKVVGTEFNVIQVRDDHGRVSWFWMGHRTHLESRVPFFRDRVKIEYGKDRLGRNAVTRIKVLR
jgi:hypothetical protein